MGFDNLTRLFDATLNDAPSYPPYNIAKAGEDAYRITFAVAGLMLIPISKLFFMHLRASRSAK